MSCNHSFVTWKRRHMESHLTDYNKIWWIKKKIPLLSPRQWILTSVSKFLDDTIVQLDHLYLYWLLLFCLSCHSIVWNHLADIYIKKNPLSSYKPLFMLQRNSFGCSFKTFEWFELQERERERWYLLFWLANDPNGTNRTWPYWKQEPGIPSRSPVWQTDAQELGKSTGSNELFYGMMTS